MNMGMLGMRGHQTQWSSIIQTAYATKMNQAEMRTGTAKPASATRAASRRRSDSARNRATLAALMAPPKNQTTSEKNLATLAAALNK